MKNIHQPKVQIQQPDGIKYMIQTHHYTEYQAQEYIDMLIEKTETYILKKNNGQRVAPLMTISQLEELLSNIKQFKIITVN